MNKSVVRLPATIPFDDIVPGARVRVCVMDGVQYLSIRDMIMCVCGKDNKRACETWDNLSQSKKDEVSDFFGNFQFPGKGQSVQPVISFVGALRLIMFLPGEAAKKYRASMAEILRRYYAGDVSLIDEVITNNGSGSPVNEMARASLAADGGEEGGRIEEDPESRKRKREDVELFKMEVDAQLALWNGKMAMVDKYKAMSGDRALDAETRELFKKALREAVAGGPGGAGEPVGVPGAICGVVHAEPDPEVDPVEINIVDMAEELEVDLNKARLKRVDGVMLNHYWRKYKRYPERAEISRHGEEFEVNLYYETDRHVMERALLGGGGGGGRKRA